nr:phage tail protein [Xenorhabdus sp. Sc-CR9]
MSTKFFALLTQLGADKLANAAALGTKIEITHMAVGDGGGSLPTPDTKQNKLINEKRRAAINTLSIDPKNTNQIIAEQVIPENEGGWWIREIGLYDKDGILIAVGNCAETYKPQLQEGSGRTQTIRMILIVSSADSVTLKVDPSVVLATREYVNDSIQKHANSRNHPDATLKEKGFVILSSAVDSNSETYAATPKAVKAAYDFANAANNNANGRLEKNKNGADVTDKDAFNRNIGSGRAFSGEITIGGGGTWTTAEFIEWLKSKGAFNHPYWMCKGTWSYANNRKITDTGCGLIHLAGAVVEVMGIEGVVTIRVTTAPTSVEGCIPNAQFTYGNHGNGYLPSWRRDYNTANKPTADEVGAYSKSETDTRVNEAKDLANARLEKKQNGADIPNKDEFVKNLGLTETKKQAQNAVPNTRKINGKSLVEDVTLSAEDIKGEARFNTTIDLTGLSSDRYYPVWWQFPANNGANSWLTIHRWYPEDREKEPFGKGITHLAGLSLQIEGGDVPWGGDSQYLNIKRISQTYRKTVKNIRYGMMSIARPIDGKYPLYQGAKSGNIVECKRYSGCYLRGGLTYHVTSNFSDIRYSRKDGEVEISRALASDNNFEIKWTAKSYSIDDPILEKDYDDMVTPYAYDLSDILYPVGIVVWFAQNKNPNTLFPKTQWKYIGENKTIRLANQNGTNVLSAGGNDSVTLTGSQIPSHNHSFSATTSSFDYGTKTTNSNGNHFHDSGWGEASGARYGIYDNTNNNVGSARTDHDNYKYKTSTEGAHSHAVHIGAHTHSVSGTTGNSGSSSVINITNSYIMLMGWYRIS